MYSTTPIPYLTDASSYYEAIAELPWAVWLDSAGMGRYDILCAQPLVTLMVYGDITEITDGAGPRQTSDDPFEVLGEILGEPVEAMPGVPFAGGALGYWGYDLAHRSRVLAGQPESLPDLAVGIYDWAIVFDHHERTARLVSHQRYPQTVAVLRKLVTRLQQPPRTAPSSEFNVDGKIQSNFTRAEYESAFDVIHGYLDAGDCYQVNLAQRFTAHAHGDAFPAYQYLRHLSPAPYSAFLNFPHAQILCASPERFLRVTEGQVETKPIKGTRPRTGDVILDAQSAQELQQSGKDRAENLMIVDLLRNDLGKSCTPGSIKVTKLFEVESYAQVHHLVSTITGSLADGQNALSLFRHCFPGGSVTGAPKQRAMQIIEELEPHRRGVYCGTIGYIGYDGNMDSNIVIRTLVYSKNEICFWVGGGIVADSQAGAEFQETLDKAAAMLKVLKQFGGK